MNYFVLLLIIFFGVSCNGQQRALANQETKEEYHVYRIDSIDNYFLVYAKKKDSIFKIVSRKEKTKKCNMIKVDNNYYFDLYAQSSIKPIIDGKEIARPVSIIDVMCYTFENDTKICTDRKNGIYDLYYARNFKGLCVD